MIRERKKETKTDTVLLILVLLLAVFGLVMLFSISEYNGRVRFGDSAYYFKKQLFATALGLMTMYIVAETDYRFFVRLAPAAYLLSMGLSTAVLFVGLFEGCAEYYSGCGHGIEQNKQHHHSHTIFLVVQNFFFHSNPPDNENYPLRDINMISFRYQNVNTYKRVIENFSFFSR